MSTAVPDVSRLGELALAWLLARGERTGVKSELSRALRAYVEPWWTAGEWSGELDELLAGLARDGLVKPAGRAGFALTAAGKARALAVLGVERLPRGTGWRQVKGRLLVARALGLDPSQDSMERLGGADGLVAALIKRQHGLPLSNTPTLAQARDRLLWRQLGLESDRPFTLNALRTVLLSRVLQSEREQAPDAALRQLAAQAVNARRSDPDELRLAAVRGWLAPATEAKPAAHVKPVGGMKPLGEAKPLAAHGLPDGLPAFAERVLEAARSSRTGRFGQRKVFISHVYRALPALGLDADSFKQRLIEANRARLLSLSRADLVEAMDPADVSASEIRHFGSTFHFIAL